MNENFIRALLIILKLKKYIKYAITVFIFQWLVLLIKSSAQIYNKLLYDNLSMCRNKTRSLKSYSFS